MPTEHSQPIAAHHLKMKIIVLETGKTSNNSICWQNTATPTFNSWIWFLNRCYWWGTGDCSRTWSTLGSWWSRRPSCRRFLCNKMQKCNLQSKQGDPTVECPQNTDGFWDSKTAWIPFLRLKTRMDNFGTGSRQSSLIADRRWQYEW